ncbi:MAG: iron-containing alcohol dehydrogenase [Candidatus Aenigmatarchaeota archaeon]
MLPIKNFEFRIPQRIIYGIGCYKKIIELVKEMNSRNILLVTGKKVIETNYVKEIIESIKKMNINIEIFNEIPKEPEMDFVYNGLKIYEEKNCELIIAIGGGSVLDTAKGIALLATNGGSLRDYEGLEKIPKSQAPLIAVPTTAGTGSEVTKFTVITDTERKRKMLIGSVNIIPKIAIVDPLLTISMPQDITMSTGMDALTHAIEAYISIKAQPITDLLAIEAIKLISKYLRRAWANGEDIEAREKVMLGSLLAGLAFSNSSVALAHGMARPLGAYFNIPHGLSNAILLPHVMEFTYISNPEKFMNIASCMSEKIDGLPLIEAAKLSIEAVKKICKDIKVPSLKNIGIKEEELNKLAPKMAEEAIASGSPANNPRKATIEEIVEIYKKAFHGF